MTRANLTPRRIAGLALIASPFLGLAAFTMWQAGPLVTLGIFALAGLIVATIAGGHHLLTEDG